MGGFDSFSDFQFFGDGSKCTSYKWYYSHSHVPPPFRFPSKVLVFVTLSYFFSFSLCGLLGWQNSLDGKFSFFFLSFLFLFFFLINNRSGLQRGWSIFVSQNPKVSYFLGWILVCANIISLNDQNSISCTIPSRSSSPPSQVFIWCQVGAFAYNVINPLIFLST